MIPVRPAPEPSSFDAKVRKPGLAAIAERVGEAPKGPRRRGRRREAVATRREDLRPEHFPPYWRACLDDLLASYDRMCAYACLYIEHVTGAATVEHFAPKSRRWDQVYEWTNYRLACSLMNARKNDFGDILDPFTLEGGELALDLLTMKAIPGPKATGALLPVAEQTIKRLGLDGPEYAAALEEYYHCYIESLIHLKHLERRAPFLASELRRQGKLRPGDV